jgi:regulatory protein
LRLLRYRARSEGEVRQRLSRRGVPAAVQDKLIEELREVSLVSDEEFARSWIQSRAATRPRGRRGLRWELRTKGVPEEIIDAAISDLMPPEQEAQQAMELAARLWRKQAGDATQRWEKVRQALSRRGFGPECIAAARDHLRAARS